MGKIFDFNKFTDEPDIFSMDKSELLNHLASLRTQIAILDAAEPADMESEEYEIWGEQHEDLEDQLDEVLDLLEEIP